MAKTTQKAWTSARLFLQMTGAIALLTWLLFSGVRIWVKVLAFPGAMLLLAALYLLVKEIERKRVRKEIAEMLCEVGFVRPPRWNNRSVDNYKLRGPAIKALIAEHNRVARNVEFELLRLGYRKKDTRKAIEIGRYEHRLHTYESLFEFASRKLSGEDSRSRVLRR